MLDRVRFVSSYVYSPKGGGGVSVRSRLLCRALKVADSRWLARYAANVRSMLGEYPALREVFDARAILVPVPGRLARWRPNPVADGLAQALLDAGIGQCAWRGLRRIESVAKSAMATPMERPSVATHYRSMRVDEAQRLAGVHAAPLKIVLIDDVITKGCTLLAAASRLHEALPAAHISAFALLRTMGRVRDIESLIAPCSGEIRWVRGDAWRNP
jgi:predicted amidophosphoribosyltransferase